MATIYADHDVSRHVTDHLSTMGHEVTTARTANRQWAPDDAHLIEAIARKAVLLTSNGRDFILLNGAWRRWTAYLGSQEKHYGILVIPQRAPDQWMAEQIHHFFHQSYSLANELYRFRQSGGWEHYPAQDGA